ncbi:MAG: hypothetical protein RLZ44_85 [Pseudomonadota bacterium]|jgi:hypothetical protein
MKPKLVVTLASIAAASAALLFAGAVQAQGGSLVCTGKGDKENDFAAYYNGRDFTEIVFTDRKSGAKTVVPLESKGKNDNGKPVWKGDHPWKKANIKLVAPKDLAPGKKITMKWGEDHEKNGTCQHGAMPR